ncbi:protein of unknown function (plasmid) [Pararobbsia alpina]
MLTFSQSRHIRSLRARWVLADEFHVIGVGPVSLACPVDVAFSMNFFDAKGQNRSPPGKCLYRTRDGLVRALVGS